MFNLNWNIAESAFKLNSSSSTISMDYPTTTGFIQVDEIFGIIGNNSIYYRENYKLSNWKLLYSTDLISSFTALFCDSVS